MPAPDGIHREKRNQFLDKKVPDMGKSAEYVKGVPWNKTVPNKEGEYKKGGD